MEKPKFEFLEHTADIKFRSYGKTLNEIFENVVLAIAAYINKGDKINPIKSKIISVKGNDQESLLYNFVDEILYLIDAKEFVPGKAKVTVRGNNLQAEFFGDKVSNYHLDHIKAATYAEMHIKKVKGKDYTEGDYWEAQMVLDV